jgi:ATP-dependent Lhr-like helicase
VNEDFAIESSHGDVFQLGNASWRIVRQERGTLRVIDAKGAPPTLPFWFGEAPSRTPELAAQISAVRDHCAETLVQAKRDKKPREERRKLAAATVESESHLPLAAAEQIADQIAAGVAVLGAVPTTKRMVLERFFDESGGMQMVLHAPFGGRVNRAFGLALRKRFCRGFGFELQAAANEDAIVISLGTMHSFPLEEVFNYLQPDSARELLIQALLAQPMFTTRWRWNLTRSLLMERMKDGKKVPAPLQRMRADDRLAAAFPQAVACGETLPPGDLQVPYDHPIVRQTVEDCLHEVLDVDGFLAVVRGLHDGTIERVAVDTAEPSAFARSILAIRPYGFLDDAPLEERRTQAVMQRRVLEKEDADAIGALDPDAVARVKSEAWPAPENAEELHEALTWMGWVTDDEAEPWRAWLEELAAARRVIHEDATNTDSNGARSGRWLAADSTRDPKLMLKGRLEALGPISEPAGAAGRGEPAGEALAILYALEQEGFVLRTRVGGRRHWCERRLLARIHRYTLERLRKEIEPVSAKAFMRFLAHWQDLDPENQGDGPQGLLTLIQQLAGFEIPAAAWESQVLPRRMKSFRREWLDQLALTGEIAWGRLWGGGAASIKTTPICLLPRVELPQWMELTGPPDHAEMSGAANDLLAALDANGAMFPRDLQRASRLLDSHFEAGLQELVARGAITCDSYGALRQLIVPPSKRRLKILTVGRWSRFRRDDAPATETRSFTPANVEFVARQLLKRWGVVFRRLLARERIPVPWRELVRVYRTLELRGELRGGRFVGGFDGEQYAALDSIPLLRKIRREQEEMPSDPIDVAAADPLNLVGILTTEMRVAAGRRRNVAVG